MFNYPVPRSEELIGDDTSPLRGQAGHSMFVTRSSGGALRIVWERRKDRVVERGWGSKIGGIFLVQERVTPGI